MTASIETQRASGFSGSERFDEPGAYVEAVRRLWVHHVEQGHVIESDHGRIRVRDREGMRIATYWFVH